MKKVKLLIIISFFIALIPIISTAKYYQKISNIKIGFELAEPILEIEKNQSTIKKDIINIEKIDEFYFDIRNYKKENYKKISEVKLFYNIEIKVNNEKLLEECKLYDCKTGEELLNGKYITKNILVDKNIEYENTYKLVISLKKSQIKTQEKIYIDIHINTEQEI